jgi:hypothetical protein
MSPARAFIVEIGIIDEPTGGAGVALGNLLIAGSCGQDSSDLPAEIDGTTVQLKLSIGIQDRTVRNCFGRMQRAGAVGKADV